MKKVGYFVFVFLLVAAGFAVGAVAVKFLKPQPAVAQDEGGGILTTRQFQIVDTDDKLKMLLATDNDDNTPSVTAYDDNGNYRSLYKLTAAGEPELMFYDNHNNAGIVISATNDEGEKITLYDKDSKPLWTKP